MVLSHTFGVALCAHLGIPAGKVLELKLHTEAGEVFGVSVRIGLTAEDLAGIAKRMDAGAAAAPGNDQAA